MRKSLVSVEILHLWVIFISTFSLRFYPARFTKFSIKVRNLLLLLVRAESILIFFWHAILVIFFDSLEESFI